MFNSESICITDTNLTYPGPFIIFVNDKLCEITGYKKEELIGKSPRIFQGPNSNKDAHKKLKEILPKGEFFQGTTVNYRKDGSEYHVAWNINPVINDGKIIAYLSVQTVIDSIEEQLLKIKILNQQILENIDQLHYV